MKITTITIGLSRTVSLPGYENVKPSISFTAEPGPDDNQAKIVNELNILCQLYVNEQIDEALEGADQSPRFYCGTLYTAHRWEQAHAIVMLTKGIDVDELPGDWHAITGSPVRKATALERARREAKKANWDLWDWSARGAEKVLEWWNARTWYVAYRLDRWLDHWEHEPAQIVVVSAAAEARDWDVTGLTRPRDDDLSKLSYRPRQLEEILKLIPPLPWMVADDEPALRAIVADWQAANPRPDPSGTAGLQGPQSGPIDDERDYDPEEDPGP